MFSIYTPQGVAFTGPLEDLHRVNQVNRTSRTRKVEERGDERPQHQKAIREYLETLEGAHEKESLIHTFQIMSRPVTTLPSDATLLQAWQRIRQSGFHLLPVVNSQSVLTGALEQEELALLLIDHAHDPAYLQQTIGAYLAAQNRQIIAAAPVTHVRRVASVLVDQGLSALPVVDDPGTVIGLISRTDILRCIVNEPGFNIWC